MKVFIDTNVFIDVLVLRDNVQFTTDAARTMSALKKLPLTACIATISVPTIAYVLKGLKPDEKKARLWAILENIDILPSHKKHAEFALGKDFSDIEDAMQYACALENACELIITRDVKDFRASGIPVMTPAMFLAEITAH